MFARNKVVAVLLSVLIAAPAMPAAAADCTQAVGRVRTEAEAFQSEAQRMSLKFVRDEYLVRSLGVAQKELADDSWRPGMAPSEEAAWALKTGKAKLDDWTAKVEAWSLEMDRVRQCVDAAPNCKLSDLLDKVNEDLGVWLKSLGSDLAERVAEADELLKGYTKRLAGSALGSARDATSCMDERLAQQASSAPADLPPPASPEPVTPPPDTPAPKAKKGGSALPLVVLLGTLAAGGLMLGAYCNQNPAACGGTADTSSDGYGGGSASGRCSADSPANACAACTCVPGHCNPSSQCGGGDCWTSSSVPPFCN